MERLDSKPGNNQFHGSRACRINRYAICTGEFSVSCAGLAPRHNEIATAVEHLHSILIPVSDECQRSVKTGQVR